MEGSSYTTHSLNAVREELLSLFSQDIVITEKFPALKNRLVQSLGKRPDSNGQLKGLKYQLQCYYSVLEQEYDTALVHRLAFAIENKTEDQYRLISQFISRCVDLGWSVKALSGKIETLKSSSGEDNKIEDFLCKIISARCQTYVILLPFRLKVSPKNGKTKDETRTEVIEQLRAFGIETRAGCQIPEVYPDIDSSQIKNTLDYMIVETNAYDVFSAAHLAIINLSRVLNIFSFFTYIESWTVNDITLVAYNTDSPYTKSQKASEIYKTYEYLDSSSRVYSRTAEFISRNKYNHPLSQKLLSSFSYANLSRSSMALEEKYINIWIALESLCRIDTYDNIIDSVKALVPNALCLRYAYRLVRNFIEDCNRCELSFEFSTKSVNLKAGDKEKLVAETISLFRDSMLYAELESKCKCSSLLLCRCKEMHSFLTDIQVFINRIKNHRTTVSWHLDRLYRVRNEIAHSGALQAISTIRYTEHLYDYLATLVSEIMRYSEIKSLTSLGEIFAIINDSYKEFCDLSGAKKPVDKQIALGKLWETGIMDYL